MIRAGLFLALSFVVAPSGGSAAAEPQDYYRFLSRSDIGADVFSGTKPAWDGRGVVIAVLDTGVDPVAGLRKTPDGQQKIIEARDFTGQGDVTLRAARPDGQVLRSDDGVVRGHGALPAPDDQGFKLGFFDEKRLANSAVTDVNRNGRSDDRFAIVSWVPADAGEAVAVVDTDGDGDLSDEQVRKSFGVDPVFFSFSHPDPRKNQTPVSFALTALPREDKVELHFDDGAHGTHCAGIAAGFGIEGRKGFDGIAPGARVMSLKIGHNALAGGATTADSMRKAIEFASKWATDHDTPVVMNLSYGIGSEIEGTSDIDKVLDDALRGNRLLVATVSAGNSGPGLSTVGTPAASRLAWTAGALLNKANAEALWGGRIKTKRVFGFSSRGGELAKPDGLSPGVAWSTVPPFDRGAVKAGTSMAAPQAAGAMALLISAARAEGVAWTSGKLKRALKDSARPLKGFTSVDQGAGVIRVDAAWKVLKRSRAHRAGARIVDWEVSTDLPSRPGEQSPASYWRTGHYVPSAPRDLNFTIKPIFFDDVSDEERLESFDVIELSEDVGWLDADRGSLALRGTQSASVKVRIDADDIADKTGLHVGHVRAEIDGIEAFTLPVVVVVPHRFVTTRTRRFEGRLEAGDIGRIFVEVPPGATSMSARLDTPEGKFGSTWLLAHDPDGRRYHPWSTHASSETGGAEMIISGKDLAPGVWELDTYASFRNKDRSHWKLEVAFHGIASPHEVDYVVGEDGSAEASVTLTNRFDEPLFGSASARLLGVARVQEVTIEGETKKIDFTLAAHHTGADFRLSMSKEDYNKFTDIAVSVYDATGKAVAQGGFGNRFTELGFDGGPGSYTLELVGAATWAEDDKTRWSVTIDELRREPAQLTVSAPGGGDALTLYPNIPNRLTLTASQPLTEPPDGFHRRASLTLTEARTKRPWLVVPVNLVKP